MNKGISIKSAVVGMFIFSIAQMYFGAAPSVDAQADNAPQLSEFAQAWAGQAKGGAASGKPASNSDDVKCAKVYVHRGGTSIATYQLTAPGCEYSASIKSLKPAHPKRNSANVTLTK